MPRKNHQLIKSKQQIDQESEGYKQKKREDELKRKVVELGLETKEIELPPDEVEESDVAKTTMHTLRAFIPYTNEWWGANTAEEVLDGLKKIREEISAANKLVTMSRMGKHEEALDTMMPDTNNDFHYFNKLKVKETERGYVWIPPNLNPWKDSNASNRLKKAIRMHYSILDDNLLKHITMSSKTTKKNANDPRNKKCKWR